MKYKLHPAARQELSQSTRFYLRRDIPASLKFIESLHRALDLICEYPGGGALLGEGIRHWPADGFPFAIIYTHKPSGIIVIAIAHTSRRPGYWVTRLE